MASILIIGAAGMLGRKLAARLAGSDSLILHDIVQPESPPGAAASCHASDLSEPGAAAALLASRPDVIYHLAAVVSGEAEADFDKGYRINLDGTRHLLDAIRHAGGSYRPRLVFASSLAVFGAPLPDVIPDDYALTPLSSYGTQKAIGELLVADYSRRGIIDGIGLRLPTVCVRPGKPNAAASGFFSGIIREPLERAGGGAARAHRPAALVRLPPRRDRLPGPCRHARPGGAGHAADADHAGHLGQRRPTRSRRCAGPRGTQRWPVSATSRTRPSSPSSSPGRARSIARGRGRSASPQTATSTRSCRSTAKTT